MAYFFMINILQDDEKRGSFSFLLISNVWFNKSWFSRLLQHEFYYSYCGWSIWRIFILTQIYIRDMRNILIIFWDSCGFFFGTTPKLKWWLFLKNNCNIELNTPICISNFYIEITDFSLMLHYFVILYIGHF